MGYRSTRKEDSCLKIGIISFYLMFWVLDDIVSICGRSWVRIISFLFLCKIVMITQKMGIFTTWNLHFLTLPFISSQPMMVKRQTIPHLSALVGGFKILRDQLCSSLRGWHATSHLKIVFFTRKVAWLSLTELHGCSWDILKPTSRCLKWGIIYLSSISGSHSNSLFIKYSNPPYGYIWAVVYILNHLT